MYSRLDRSLLDVLEESGALSEEESAQVRARLRLAAEEDLEEVLREYLPPRVIELAKRSLEYGVPFVLLEGRSAEPEALQTMRASYAFQQKVVPLALEGETLVVAMADPLNVELVDELRVVTGHEVRPLLAEVEDIEEAVRRFYGKTTRELVEGRLAAPTGSVELETVEEIHDYGLQADLLARDPTVMEAVNQLIIDAVREGATDIHIEPFEEELQIRFRIDGVLERRPAPPKHLQAAITSRVKLMAGMNIAETRRPQDGRIEVRIATLGRREIDIRVSTVPTIWGESVAMRILDKNTVRRGLTELGLMEDDYQILQRMIRKPWGIILATGPTGSGKTTTLNAILTEINEEGSKIITVEDPVEYDLPGINQINVNPELNVTFDRALRHILRQDPDKVMVGEIRDLETAEMAIHTSLTGHLVLSSLHTNDAPQAITRLISMGVDPYLVSATLEGVIAQRLPRRVCKNCARYEKPTPEELLEFGIDPDTAQDDWLVPRPVGCRECRNTGYRGRIGIFEIMVMNLELREMTLKNASAFELRDAAVRAGMHSLRQDGWRKVLAGITTMEEVRRFTPDEDVFQELRR
ncbi:MAG: type IV fimbrial assembly protein PilB [Candidatus Poribacteria bacterium]|nr:MAG: type IV fimbrial assembly protein PilB [Candidatus Poribacteria bacterium]